LCFDSWQIQELFPFSRPTLRPAQPLVATQGSLPTGKEARGWSFTSHLHIVPRLMSGAIPLLAHVPS